MIEILVKYIQDKGYTVNVRYIADSDTGVLYIRKQAKGQKFGIDWAIPKYDLRPDAEEWLYWQATCRCDQIEEAIANYQEVA